MTTFNPDEFGRILSAADPNIGVATTPDGERIAFNNETNEAFSINKIGPSLMDAVQFGSVAAAFTPGVKLATGVPAAASKLIGRQVASPLGLRTVAQAGAAGATEAGLQAGQQIKGGEFDAKEIGTAAAFGGAAELAVPAFTAGRRAIQGTGETAEQAARRTTLESQGLEPTRAQVTRETTEFQSQQELSKQSGPLRARLEQQEARLSEAFEQRAKDTQGSVVTSTNTAIDEVLERSIVQDERIAELYKQVRDISPEAKDIRLNKLSSNLRAFAGEDRATKGLISSVRGNLKQRGIIDDSGKVVGRISVDTAEEIRKDINLLFGSTSERGRQLSRQLKDSIDEDVFKVAGEDIFKQARSAKQSFEEGLDRAKISRFDKRKNNLVRDMLDNKVSPDTFVGDVVFAKKWRKDDINQLKLFLNQSPKGKQAWNDLRAQTFDEIRERSFKGPVREDGATQSLSKSALDKTLKTLEDKMSVLFTPDERVFLANMKEVAKLREPPPGTFTGKGPSAQAIRQLKNKLPFVGEFLDNMSTFRQNKLMLKLPKRLKEIKPVTVPAQAGQLVREREE